VLAETDDYVAMASEYQALSTLPGIEQAQVWEPQPATIYLWERGGQQG
jgi:glutamate synthase domain-containing protein 1